MLLLQDTVTGLTSLTALNGRSLAHGDSAGRRRALYVATFTPLPPSRHAQCLHTERLSPLSPSSQSVLGLSPSHKRARLGCITG